MCPKKAYFDLRRLQSSSQSRKLVVSPLRHRNRPGQRQFFCREADDYPTIRMSLVSGPGRGGQNANLLPVELTLAIDQHVKYIQQLDTVRRLR